MSKPDWGKIQLEYVHGTMSIRELAEKHGTNVSTTLARGHRERWADLREQRQSELYKEAEKKIVKTKAQKLAELNDFTHNLAKIGLNKTMSALQKASDSRDIRALLTSAQAAQQIGRISLGAPTHEYKVDQRTELSGPGGVPLLGDLNDLLSNIEMRIRVDESSDQ